MGDSKNSLPDRPRPARVVCGGILAWAGLVVGAWVATPSYQLAHTTRATPETMSWEQLLDRGLFDNAHVRLTDVRLAETAPEELDFHGELDFQASEGGPAESSAALLAPSAPLDVVPAGAAGGVAPGTILVAPLPESVAAARAEVDSSGTLTGRFQPVAGDLNPALTLLTGSAETPEWLTPDSRYVFVPADTVSDRVTAFGWWVGSIVAVVTGLVMAGSGRPGWRMWLAMTVPSSLSLLGRPLRRGSNRSTWRTIYAAAGLGLVVYGYRQFTVVTRWWLVDADPHAMTLGFLFLTLGLASISGAAVSGLVSRLRFRNRRRREASWAEPLMTSATMQRAPNYSRRYFDPRFRVETDVELDQATLSLTAALEKIDFESPLLIGVVDDDRVIPTTVQIGCQSLAMAIVETVDPRTRIRLVTVLEDGFVVITVESEASEPRECHAGVIDSNPNHDPVTLLSAHLDRITSLAEERGVAPLTLHSSEWRDVYLVAGRVSADIEHRHGASNRCVGEAVHGRFQFPIAPKQPLAGCLG